MNIIKIALIVVSRKRKIEGFNSTYSEMEIHSVGNRPAVASTQVPLKQTQKKSS